MIKGVDPGVFGSMCSTCWVLTRPVVPVSLSLSLRIPEQEAVSSLLKQGDQCLETRGAEGLALGECRGHGANRPASQVHSPAPTLSSL